MCIENIEDIENIYITEMWQIIIYLLFMVARGRYILRAFRISQFISNI